MSIVSIESMAAAFNEAYERIAPQFGYDREPNVRAEWSHVRPMLMAVFKDLVDSGRIVDTARLAVIKGAAGAHGWHPGIDLFHWLDLKLSRQGDQNQNPRPRLFEFCTGDEIDVDRYISLNMQGSTAFLQTRHSYIRVEFDSVEQMRSEIERMRRFRDPLQAYEADPVARADADAVEQFAVGDRVRTKDGKTGTVARIHDAPHDYVIEMDDPDPRGCVIMHWPVVADGLQAL